MSKEEEFSDLMSNVMNIQCRLKDEDFSDRAERLTYKAGHRDARHDAVELIAEFASRCSAQGANTSASTTQAAANKAAEEGGLDLDELEARVGFFAPWEQKELLDHVRASRQVATPPASTVLTDERIEALFKAKGGKWADGDEEGFWKIEDADLHPFVREVAAQAGQVAVPDDVVRDAARWRFMMRVADDAEGAEALAMESLGNEQMETERPESEQMCELVDQAIAKVAAPSPAKESK